MYFVYEMLAANISIAYSYENYYPFRGFHLNNDI